MNSSVSSSFVTSDGALIHFSVDGPADARHHLVLLHSLAMDRQFWQPVVARMRTHTRILTLDIRGHGQSTLGRSPMSVERCAQDVAELTEQLAFPPCLVAGASMGGCVALQFAASYPQRCVGLGLIDTTAWYGPTAPADWAGRAEKARREGLAALVDFQVTRWFSDAFRDTHPEVVRACVDTFLRNDLDAYGASCAMLGAFDGRALLAGIALPTCVLVGEEDYAAPLAMALELQAGIRHATLAVIPATRHLTPLEVPDVVADALERLFERTQAV